MYVYYLCTCRINIVNPCRRITAIKENYTIVDEVLITRNILEIFQHYISRNYEAIVLYIFDLETMYLRYCVPIYVCIWFKSTILCY